jgi:hypothetical protein
MTAISEAWGGSAFSQPIVSDVKPQAANAATATLSERDTRDFVRSYVRRQYDLFGARGVAPLLGTDLVSSLRTHSLLSPENWGDAEIAVVLALIGLAIVLAAD